MSAEKRIPTGIAGLDRVIEGGVRDNTTFLVVGSSGTGKSTFAMQYLNYGLEHGENGLYISMEEPPEQIMREAKMLGFNLDKYYEKELFFFHSKGKDFVKLVDEQLPALVEANRNYSVKTRVIIDPLTPLIWAIQDKQEQREIITKLFYTLKQLGPVLITTEEHSSPGETVGEDVLIPIYMSDGAVHLTYRPIGGAFNRALEIIKMRATRHGEEVYPYIFVRGVGVVVRTTPLVSAEDMRKYDDVFDKAIRTAADLGAGERMLERLVYVKENWSYPFSPKETLQIFFESQGLNDAVTREDLARRKEKEASSPEVPLDIGDLSGGTLQIEDTKFMQDETLFSDSDDGGVIEIDSLSELEELIQ
ncbi:ATPase domain-containing protein [Methanolobus mangrovi]|uniref:ATPase domain-containing protein n=1 Tax=Methanolobus mangrovi TaxID=3072977 RepID=A0AA51YHH2_9EURY|nr:ATPase domain-containing protein [Methanolobus mangrovi]WMW23161.1 ATPase domain-containing protein [Methanolobus mangrovi]